MQKEQKLPELSFRALLLGSLLTIIFTASNVYLGLKVGLTFSSSIPAVIIWLFCQCLKTQIYLKTT